MTKFPCKLSLSRNIKIISIIGIVIAILLLRMNIQKSLAVSNNNETILANQFFLVQTTSEQQLYPDPNSQIEEVFINVSESNPYPYSDPNSSLPDNYSIDTTLSLFIPQVSKQIAESICLPVTGNYRAMGYTEPGPFFGGQIKFFEANYFTADYLSGGFTSNALWNLHTNGYFEEIGFSRGWHLQDIYVFYVAFQKSDGYNEYRLATAPLGFGTNHTFTIYRSQDPKEWIIKLDDVEFFGIRYEIEMTSWQLEVGGEMTSNQSIMNPTISSNLKYFLFPQQGDPQNWGNNFSNCGVKPPMHWEWITFPVIGKAWAP